jgi:glycosyltransferase involved in cell wall biosynthesis
MRESRVIAALEALELFLYRRARAVVALTDAFKANLVARGIPPDKIAVVRNGVDLPRYAPRERDCDHAAAVRLEGKFVIGYVGTHGMAHDLGRALDAAEKLRDEPRIVFLLVGAGAEREALIADAKRRALDNVFFLPMQPKEAMPSIWSICDVALVHLKDSPAFAEVIPSKIFEAMAMGLPILLVSPAGEASRIIAEDGAGIWTPAGDPAAVAAAAKQLMLDDTLRRTLAARSLVAAQSHSRERQAELVLACLKEIVDRSGGAL